jgi:catechol 2,3-dioxygenase-like lactoylglutathione lyase family enzyme
MASLTVTGLLHVNQLVDDFDAARAFYASVFGAHEYWTGYDPTEDRDASLFLVGDTCIELFAPRDARSLLGASLARFGNSWHSFEWQVPDLEAAREVLAERDVRVPTYRPRSFLMTHPADCHGMLIELCPLEMTGDPRNRPGWSAAHWRDEHPMGLTGLRALSFAVRDLDAAERWLTGLVGTAARYRECRVEIDAVVAAVPVAGVDVELVQPLSTASPVAEYIGRYGQRLRSIEFGVVDVERAGRHLTDCGIRVVAGSRRDAIATHEADNWGVRWEFAQLPIE